MKPNPFQLIPELILALQRAGLSQPDAEHMAQLFVAALLVSQRVVTHQDKLGLPARFSRALVDILEVFPQWLPSSNPAQRP